jgi:alpha-methylacyl-CoA racemase
LTMEEAMEHPHNVERNSFVTIDGATQPAPAPRFSRTKEGIQFPAPIPGENTLSVLKDWGFSASDIESLKDNDII